MVEAERRRERERGRDDEESNLDLPPSTLVQKHLGHSLSLLPLSLSLFGCITSHQPTAPPPPSTRPWTRLSLSRLRLPAFNPSLPQ